MTLILTEQILGDLIRAIQLESNGAMDDASCLEAIARGFGFSTPLELLSAITETPPPVAAIEPEPTTVLPVLDFWRSGLLNGFITDYSCRRRPIVVFLSGRNSIIIISSAPPRIFEISQNDEVIELRDMGSGPEVSQEVSPLGHFDTPFQAFDMLCRMYRWEWSHSSAEDVS